MMLFITCNNASINPTGGLKSLKGGTIILFSITAVFSDLEPTFKKQNHVLLVVCAEIF